MEYLRYIRHYSQDSLLKCNYLIMRLVAIHITETELITFGKSAITLYKCT